MKYALIIALTLISSTAFAGEPPCKPTPGLECTVETSKTTTTEVPANLEGATIIVRTKDGKETIVPASKFKVVPRTKQVVSTRVEHVVAPVIVTVTERKPRRNRLSLLGGYGSKGGINASMTGPFAYEAESKYGFVAGAQYQRLLTERFSLGLQAQTNKTYSILAGFDF